MSEPAAARYRVFSCSVSMSESVRKPRARYIAAMDVAWKRIKSLSYARAKRRAVEDVIGTAYWSQSSGKHHLWVKVKEDGWLCFGGRRIEACLAEFAKTPGKGARSSDFLIANGIAIEPTSQTILMRGHLPTKSRAAKTSAAKPRAAKPSAPAARAARGGPVEALWRDLAERGAAVIWRRATVGDVRDAERALAFRFPRSYVELVTGPGAPAIAPGRARGAESMMFAVLLPKEVVRFTKQMRRVHRDMFEDETSLPRVKAQLANAVMFQLQAEPSDGYVFLTNTANADGEMKVADFAHDYVEELDWRPKSKVVYTSFLAATRHVVATIANDWAL